MSARSHRLAGLVAGAVILSAALAGCSGDSTSSNTAAAGDSGADGAATSQAPQTATVEISYLVQNDEQSVINATKMAEAFMAENPTIKVTVEPQPAGTEGDNLMKTKLATGEMNDVFNYNSGSLFQALNPDQNLVDLSDQAWVADVTDDFLSTVRTDNGIYGAPTGTTFGGGVLYNVPAYEALGLDIPTSWAEFMANCEKIKAESPGVAPILQSFGETWTSQIFVLASFASIDQEDPTWAENYTAGLSKYATQPGLAGFLHQQETFDAGYYNEDFPSMKLEQALQALANGEGVHFPMLTNQVNALNAIDPETMTTIGFFAMPADDPQYTAATIWQPNGLYIPKTTTGDKLDAAKAFIAFMVSSPTACAISQETGIPSGPYVTSSCKLTGDVPRMVLDMEPYFDAEMTAPALEFLSPIKGPNLENIAIEVGSGIVTAQEGAEAYDDDVKKQAQQLGLNW